MSRQSWNGFNTVLCAIDFSELSRHALRHAAVLATRARGRLVVLVVNDPLLAAAATAARPHLNLREQSAAELDRFVRTTLGATALTAIDRRVTTGEPADRILFSARAVGADLIVVGSQGLTGIARFAFGSTTTAVLKQSPVPVLVVRANNAAVRREPYSWPRGHIVAPVMLDRRTADDIDVLSRVAAWFSCSLTLVHVLTGPLAPPWLRRRLSGRNAHKLERTRRRLASAAGSHARVPTRVRVLEGSPAEMIAAVATPRRTPLLIMMLRDRRRWFEPGRGALTYRILTQVDVPVLACPPRWRPR